MSVMTLFVCLSSARQQRMACLTDELYIEGNLCLCVERPEPTVHITETMFSFSLSPLLSEMAYLNPSVVRTQDHVHSYITTTDHIFS